MLGDGARLDVIIGGDVRACAVKKSIWREDPNWTPGPNKVANDSYVTIKSNFSFIFDLEHKVDSLTDAIVHQWLISDIETESSNRVRKYFHRWSTAFLGGDHIIVVSPGQTVSRDLEVVLCHRVEERTLA